ncbi:MAG: hypothetical protein WDO73_03225 [Ignavibacteriota bacterium]
MDVDNRTEVVRYPPPDTPKREADMPLPGEALGKRLVLVFVPIAIMALVTLYLQGTIVAMERLQNSAIAQLSRKVQIAGSLGRLAQHMRSDSRGLLLAAYARDGEFLSRARDSYRGALAEFEANLETAALLSDGDSENDILEGLRRDVTAWQPEFANFQRLCAEGDTGGAERIRAAKLVPLADEEDALTDRFKAEPMRDLAEARIQARRMMVESRSVSIALLILCAVVGLVSAGVVRGINLQLRRVVTETLGRSARIPARSGKLARLETAAAMIFSRDTIGTIRGDRTGHSRAEARQRRAAGQ